MEELIPKKKYKASVYLRISKEDGDKSESDSIGNQRALIYHFLRDKPDIEVVSERIDDGYSGVDFERPAIKKLIEDAENGVINCLVVKDLSRFGRNYIEVGVYLDRIFPSLGVRVISINENFDSAKGRTQSDNIVLPFLSLINDAYLRDISVKVRSQLEIKRKNGDFIGAFAVYGYVKDPNDRHKLIVDEFASEIVRDIFRWKTDGLSMQKIADRLNESRVLSPVEYKKSCGLFYQTSFNVKIKALWSASTVRRILKDEVYTGTLVQGKRTTPNHKVKRVINLPKEKWIRVKNTHEAIISEEDFKLVDKILRADTRTSPTKNEVYPFSGLIFCADCGNQLIRSSSGKTHKKYCYYMCGVHRRTQKCTAHRVGCDVLNEAVLMSLKHQISNTIDGEKLLHKTTFSPLKKQKISRIDKCVNVNEGEIRRYENLKIALFENFSQGVLSEKEYVKLKGIYDEKQIICENKLCELKSEMQNNDGNDERIKKFREKSNIENINRKNAVMLIDKIIVHNTKRMEIKLNYRDIYKLG